MAVIRRSACVRAATTGRAAAARELDELVDVLEAEGIVPVAPGKILINPDRPIKRLPDVLRDSGWEMLTPPRSTLPNVPAYQNFAWLHVDVLMLDERRIIVEKHEESFIAALKDWGFLPIPVAFRSNHLKGGGLHCATVDIRRRGTLKSYF